MVPSAMAVTAVCSAHAEVIPSRPMKLQVPRCLLRTRGGDPLLRTYSEVAWESAPHTRR